MPRSTRIFSEPWQSRQGCRFYIAIGIAVLLAASAGGQGTGSVLGAWMPNATPGAVPAPAGEPCEAPGMPALLETSYPIELVERGDRVLMRFTEWDVARTIYMNPRNGPAVQDHSPLGVSFGRWEGETLAIFTAYISHPFRDRGASTPQSRDVTVLERYTPAASSARLEWRMTVTDPAMLPEAVTRRGTMTAIAPGAAAPADCAL